MRVLLLGGVGAVSADASRDIAGRGSFDHLVLADADLEKAKGFAEEIGLPASKVRKIDATDQRALVALMSGFDVVLNGLPKALGEKYIDAEVTKWNVQSFGLKKHCRLLRQKPDLLDGAYKSRMSYRE